MRKRLLCIAFLVTCLLALGGCDVSSMSTLAEISRPYTGEYRCEKLLLGGEDLLRHFEYIRLDLAQGGEFKVTYRGIEGNRGEFGGKYSLSKEMDEIALTARYGGKTVTRVFPYTKGAVVIEENLGGKLLYAEFRFP